MSWPDPSCLTIAKGSTDPINCSSSLCPIVTFFFSTRDKITQAGVAKTDGLQFPQGGSIY